MEFIYKGASCSSSSRYQKIHTKEKKDDKGNTKKWNMYELGDYEWLNYGDAKKNTDTMAAWLLDQGFKKGDRMLIYAKTR